MRFQTPLAATLTMATLFVAGPPAAAQTQQAVISAPRPSPSPRVDIHAACPDVAETLNRELGPATLMHGKSGTVRVEFSLAADQPIDVVSRGGPREYRESIRRAVRQLTCDRSAGGSRFVFEIRFELDAPSDAPRRLAHLVIQ
jgi:hypothetical protein